MLLALPSIVGQVAELGLGVLADRGWRHTLIVGGGVAFSLALALMGAASSFWILAVGLALFGPASGAFVSLSQAALMDLDPARREKNMARWVVAAWLGNLLGPALIGLALVSGGGWRAAFVITAGISAAAAWIAPRVAPVGKGVQEERAPAARRLLDAAWRTGAVRWLLLLVLADLMLDVFRGYVALYLVDVAAASPGVANLGVATLTSAGLIGASVLVRLLERIPGLAYARVSSAAALVIFPAFLLVPALEARLVLVAALGLLTSGWYSVLKAKLYETLPEHSGGVVSLSTLSGMVGGLLPMALGWVAESHGLASAMWLPLAGPVALLLGIPRCGTPRSARPASRAGRE